MNKNDMRYNFQTGQYEPNPFPMLCEPEHDDFMDAEDYDRRRALRDGWISDTEGRY